MRRGLPQAVAGLGIALALVGLVVLLTSGTEPVTVYTGSYSALDAETRDEYRNVLELSLDGTVSWTVEQLVGAGLLGIGLLVLSAVGGWSPAGDPFSDLIGSGS